MVVEFDRIRILGGIKTGLFGRLKCYIALKPK
jgi:hypothetical protein